MIEVVDGAPLVIAANRDELYERPTRPPELLQAEPKIAGGVDELSGGTWLAVRADGHFAAVTNQRALATPPPGLRSRGLAVRELAASTDPDAYVAGLDPASYASMNLAWRSGRGVKVAYTRREHASIEIETLGRGVHVLCNDRLGADGFPRGERLRRTIETSLDEGVRWPALVAPLAIALADHTRVALEDTPPSHLPRELARELTATCIHSPAYGTRSSTILALDHARVIDYLHANGPPCTTELVDRRSLLR
ncbi:MAG TPA: NRDE family protein [Kofleriaceae bacterium]|nr:NRDE family protein [Kofleriaceae bacterium]